MKQQPFAPQGAPRRPIWSSLWRKVLLVSLPVYLTFGLIKQGYSTAIALIAGFPMFVWACWYISSIWRELDRDGWYELKMIECPDLPFRSTVDLRPIIFEADKAVLEYGTEVFYRDISRIEIECDGIHFRGLKLHLANGKMERTWNHCDSGEPARTAIAILQQQAPQAVIEGAMWIAEGWVPRMGFSYPGTGS